MQDYFNTKKYGLITMVTHSGTTQQKIPAFNRDLNYFTDSNLLYSAGLLSNAAALEISVFVFV